MRKQELHPRTAVINKTQKNKSKKARIDALQWLALNFPNAFDNSMRIRPLKNGIMADILLHADKALAAGISKSKLREAVVLFTRRLDYLICLKACEKRIDLNGSEVDAVNEEEANHAATKVKKRIEKGIRNARKTLAEKTAVQSVNSYHSKINQQSHSIDDTLPIYPPRAYTPPAAPTSQNRTAAVIVKHKTTKQYDPDAVARLKEKLGLSRSQEDKKESVE